MTPYKVRPRIIPLLFFLCFLTDSSPPSFFFCFVLSICSLTIIEISPPRAWLLVCRTGGEVMFAVISLGFCRTPPSPPPFHSFFSQLPAQPGPPTYFRLSLLVWVTTVEPVNAQSAVYSLFFFFFFRLLLGIVYPASPFSPPSYPTIGHGRVLPFFRYRLFWRGNVGSLFLLK